MNNGYAQELHIWGLVGAAAWFSPLFWLACSAWALVLPPASGLTSSSAVCGSIACVAGYLLCWLMQLGLLLAHHAVLSPHEAVPVQLPRLGLYGRSWPCVFVARVLLRGRKLRDAVAAAALLCATATSASIFVYTYPRVRAPQALGVPSFAFSCVFGLALGAVHTLQHLLRCRDVLAHPAIHRHRYFRLRHSLPGVLAAALRTAGLALLLAVVLRPSAAAAAATAVHLPSAGHPGGSSTGSSAGSSAGMDAAQGIMWAWCALLSQHTGALLAALHAGSLWVFGWLAGHTVLGIVLTEPPRLVEQHEGQQGASETLLKALSSPSLMLQDHALAELADIAEGTTAAHAARRATVFADETGRLGWTPLAGFLVAELREFAGGLGAALSAVTGEGVAAANKAGASSGHPPRVQWNVMCVTSGTGGAKMGSEQDRAAWSVRAKYYRVRFCLRALSGMVCASRTEDRYGVVLLCEPLLADMLACLLSTVLALQQYTKQESGFSSRRHGGLLARQAHSVLSLLGPPAHPTLQEPELCAHALEDAARAATFRVVRMFGASLQPLLKECKLPPALPQASPGALARVLQAMLAYQE